MNPEPGGGGRPDGELKLRLLYYGHSEVELSLVQGALESEDIPCLVKRDVGMPSMAPSVFFSPATEVKLYVEESDWVTAEELARQVLGDEWEPPTED